MMQHTTPTTTSVHVHHSASSARLSPTTRAAYAGAKFSESPQAKDLPPPPIRWVLDSLFTGGTEQQTVTEATEVRAMRSYTVAVPSA